jgi:phosphoribosyl-ATP pyrophosphohydrolase/phosphoribosyl-AMP cyclohydrolase
MNRLTTTDDLDRLNFGSGLVTVVAQDARSGSVLMVAHADRDALERTLASSEMHYRSRTRGLWRKGATSGNTQRLVALYHDCDADAVLALVVPAGPACHTGDTTCFGFEPTVSSGVLHQLSETIRARSLDALNATRPSYTQRLLGDRNLRLKKLGEEATELAVACADGDQARAVNEGADLMYHALVALRAVGVGIDEVARVLESRMSER